MIFKSFLTAALALGSVAQAATLTIESGNSNGNTNCTTGSCVGLDTDGTFSYLDADPDIFVNISGFQGLIVDGQTLQTASGAHLGAPDGSETPGIDNPWEFIGGTGMHYTNAPLTRTGGTGNSMSLDLTGLHLLWGDAAPGRYESAVGIYEDALVTCETLCGDGESYTLTYRMLLSAECGPEGDPSCFGRQYMYEYITLRGTIIGNDLANVPLPGAIGLFGAGLLGLLRVARRFKKT